MPQCIQSSNRFLTEITTLGEGNRFRITTKLLRQTRIGDFRFTPGSLLLNSQSLKRINRTRHRSIGGQTLGNVDISFRWLQNQHTCSGQLGLQYHLKARV